MGHVREYTPDETAHLIWDCGLNVIEIKFRGTYPNKGRFNKLANVAIRLNRKMMPNFSIIAQKR